MATHADRVTWCCPAPEPSVSRTVHGTALGLTFPGEVLLLPLPVPFCEAGFGRQLTMACMPRGQACCWGAGGATCVGQRARWGSVPRHRTLWTQKLFFWLRVFRLPRERSRGQCQLRHQRLSSTQSPWLGPCPGCPCPPWPGLSPTWSWGPSVSCSRASCGCTKPRGQGGYAKPAGLCTPHPIIPALPATPWQELELGFLPQHGRVRTGPLPTGNYHVKPSSAMCPGRTAGVLAPAGAHYRLYF